MQNFNGSHPPKIFVNGSLKTSGSDYTIGGTGVITFAVAPALNAVLTWSGSNDSVPSWYYRCIFAEDMLGDLQQDYYGYWSMGSLKFTSVIL